MRGIIGQSGTLQFLEQLVTWMIRKHSENKKKQSKSQPGVVENKLC